MKFHVHFHPYPYILILLDNTCIIILHIYSSNMQPNKTKNIFNNLRIKKSKIAVIAFKILNENQTAELFESKTWQDCSLFSCTKFTFLVD